MNKKINFRAISFPILFAAISFSNFSRSTGSDSIRPVHIVTLIATGMLLGVALTNAFRFYKEHKKVE